MHNSLYVELISGVLDELASFLGIGKRRDEFAPGLLSHPAGQHIVFYRATDELIVYRIIHGRRDLAAEFGV